MMNRSTLFAIVLITGTVYAMAQPPGGGRGGPGGPPPGQGGQGGQRGGQPGGEHGGPPPNPVLETLDSDGDHTISAAEITNASASLKKLDRNRDGQLTSDEIHPGGGPGGGGGQRGAGGPGGGGPGGQGGADGRGGPPTAEKFFSHAMTFDADNDGVLNQAELQKMAAAVVAEMGNHGAGGRGGREGSSSRQRPAVE